MDLFLLKIDLAFIMTSLVPGLVMNMTGLALCMTELVVNMCGLVMNMTELALCTTELVLHMSGLIMNMTGLALCVTELVLTRRGRPC